MKGGWTCASCVALSLVALSVFGGAQERTAATAGRRSPAAQREKEPELPPPVELRKGETIKFSLPAPTYVVGWTRCDDEGDIYLVHSSLPRPGSVPVAPPNPSAMELTRLKLDSQGMINYMPQTVDGHHTFWRDDFSVDGFGSLYALFSVLPSKNDKEMTNPASYEQVILKFDNDGSADSTVKLQDPPGGALLPFHFAVFGDGSFLVTGMVRPTGPSGRAQEPKESRPAGVGPSPRAAVADRPFTGIFDRYGRLVQELGLPDDVASYHAPSTPTGGGAAESRSGAPGAKGAEAETAKNPLWTPPTARARMAVNFSVAVTGPEDTAYLLRASNPPILYTLSSDGQVIHEAHIAPPTKNARPNNMSLAGQSSLLIQFYGVTVDKNGNTSGQQYYELVDPETGKAIAAYTLAPSEAYLYFACVAGRNDFEFVGSSKDGKLQVVQFSGN